MQLFEFMTLAQEADENVMLWTNPGLTWWTIYVIELK